MITLVLGGARSGKSAFAERIAASSAMPVTYIATAVVGADPDFAARVGAHRERRPASWETVEAGGDLIGALERATDTTGTVLIDSLGTWVAAAENFEVDSDGLCRVLAGRQGDTIVVAEEVGLGVHPSTEVGGRFRDALGSLNRAVSGVADRAFLVVAGRVVPLEPAAGRGE